MIRTILGWVATLLVAIVRCRSHEIDPEEVPSAAEKAELLQTLNPEYRVREGSSNGV